MPFTEEQLQKRRRMNAARRAFKRAPLFALMEMQESYTEYTETQFLDDLRRRSKGRRKNGKNNKLKNLKYILLQEEWRNVRQSGGYISVKLISLFKNWKKPFVFRLKNHKYFELPNTISRDSLNKFIAVMNYPEEFERLYHDFYKYHNYGS